MMKFYLLVVGWIAFLVINFYALQLVLAAMTYPFNSRFFAGLGGLLLLLWIDIRIAIRGVRKPQDLPK